MDSYPVKPPPAEKGRGLTSRAPGRFARQWSERDEPEPAGDTRVEPLPCRTLLTRNSSPDVPFEQSINPYRGCEHGCVYCFARPTHSYLELSPGLDFETRIFFKQGAEELLTKELSRRGYTCRTIAMGTATDPYQPAEKRLGLTRRILEQLSACDHPVSIVTKSSLITRDLDILGPMAEKGLASVAISVTTLDNELKSRLEPRATAGARRLETIRRLNEAGVPVTVLFAPVIPFINDHELEAIVAGAAEAGADSAGYVVLRLPHEVGPLWQEWLSIHYPQRAARVMQVVRGLHGGRDYRSQWHLRQQGGGPWSGLLAQRFRIAVKRSGMKGREGAALRTDLFHPPGDGQMSLL